jgi:hypothetical protein
VVLRAVASPSWLQTLAILQFSEGRAFRPCSKVLQPVKGAGYGNHVINWAWAGNSADNRNSKEAHIMPAMGSVACFYCDSFYWNSLLAREYGTPITRLFTARALCQLNFSAGPRQILSFFVTSSHCHLPSRHCGRVSPRLPEL